jgi:hypothetical protein
MQQGRTSFNTSAAVKPLTHEEELALFAERDRLLGDEKTAGLLAELKRLRHREAETPSGELRDSLKKQIVQMEKDKTLIPLNRVRDRVILSHYTMAMALAGQRANRFGPLRQERQEAFTSKALEALTYSFYKFDPAIGVRYSTFARTNIKFFIGDEEKALYAGSVFNRDETEVGKYISANYHTLAAQVENAHRDITTYEIDLKVADLVGEHFLKKNGESFPPAYYVERVERYKIIREAGKVSLDQPYSAGMEDSAPLGDFIPGDSDPGQEFERREELHNTANLLKDFVVFLRSSPVFSSEKEQRKLEGIYFPRFLRRLGNTEELDGRKVVELETLAQEFGVSKERIRQIEERTHQKVCALAAEFFPLRGHFIPDVFREEMVRRYNKKQKRLPAPLLALEAPEPVSA